MGGDEGEGGPNLDRISLSTPTLSLSHRRGRGYLGNFKRLWMGFSLVVRH